MCRSDRQKGLTIIEAMIAIAVLGIGIIALVGIFPLALKISKSGEQSTVGSNLAQAKMEEMFSLGYGNINIGTQAKARLSADPENPFYHYQQQTEVEYVDSNLQTSIPETGMKKITVTVFWNSPALLGERSLDLISLISETQ